MLNYKPISLDQYVGQKRIIANLKLYVQSAKQLNQPLDHIFIQGNSGMGKTALASLIANLMETKIHFLNGTSLQKISEIISVLTNLKANEIIFIDEIHAVKREILEFLYPAMETGKISLIIGKEYNAKTINLTLPKFTLIVATTEVNQIPLPFYNRFSINFKLENYSIEELGMIAFNYAQFLNLPLSLKTASYLASFSRNNPRIVLNLTKRINDFYLAKVLTDLESTFQINQMMNQLGIYQNGLTIDDLNYLKMLEQHHVLGLENLSYLLNINVKILRQVIEPLLIEQNYIIRTSQGRKLTHKGYELLMKIKNTIL